MHKIVIIESTAIPLDVENVDTDQIIPARFLKATSREGFGKNLFCDWRYDDDNQPRADFILNNPLYKGQILVAGDNFGCGSSREHAAWAIVDYGFRVVISSSFADIFRKNALNNGLLPLTVKPQILTQIMDELKKDPHIVIKVDLPEQLLTINQLNIQEKFNIDPYSKKRLINGYDDLDYLISLQDKINEKFPKDL